MAELTKIGPTLTWSKLPRENEDEKLIIEEDEKDYSSLIINKDNISAMLLEMSATQLTEDQLECAMLHLKDVINVK